MTVQKENARHQTTVQTWTEGVCGDGAAILRNGVPVSISGILAALNERDRLRNMIAAMDYAPVRYQDRPPGFIDTRKRICTSPRVCFEFGDSAPVCPPCDFQAVKELSHAE